MRHTYGPDIYMHTNKWTHTHTRIRTYIYLYIYMYIHIHTQNIYTRWTVDKQDSKSHPHCPDTASISKAFIPVEPYTVCIYEFVCVCLCVSKGERQRMMHLKGLVFHWTTHCEREREREWVRVCTCECLCVCVCVCVCAWCAWHTQGGKNILSWRVSYTDTCIHICITYLCVYIHIYIYVNVYV